MMDGKKLFWIIALLLLSSPACAIDLIMNGGTATLSGTKNYETVNLTNGAILYIQDHGPAGGGKLRIQAWKVYVDSTSQIIGAGRGYKGGSGAIACETNPAEDGEDTEGDAAQGRIDRLGAGGGGDAFLGKAKGAGGGGGGYGGTGGYAGNEVDDLGVPGVGGSPYGSSDAYESSMGAGGGGGAASCDKAAPGGRGGDGGAALEIVASHSIVFEGTIDCSGEDGVDGSSSANSGGGGGGGGAGGGVFLGAPSLNFTGSIDVSGGVGGDAGNKAGGGGGGAGGRIKLAGCEINISGGYVVSGGLVGKSSGTDGTDGGAGTYIEVSDCYTFSLLPAEIKTFQLKNLAEDTANVTLSVRGSQIWTWITLDPKVLSIPPLGKGIVTVSVYPPFFIPKGYYYGEILVNASGEDLLYVDLSIWVKRRELISLTPGSWNASLASGWKQSKVFSICNTGDTVLYDVRITTLGAADWISFSGGKDLGDLQPTECVYREGVMEVPSNASSKLYNGTVIVESQASVNATVFINVTSKNCGEWCRYSNFYGGLCRSGQDQCYFNEESFHPLGSEEYCSIYSPTTDTCCCYVSCMDACSAAGYAGWDCGDTCVGEWLNMSVGNSYCSQYQGSSNCCCENG